MSNQQRVLLYAPDIVGHPPVYCRVIADALRSHDCSILIAMGFGPQGPRTLPDLRPLIDDEKINFIDCTLRSGNGSQYLSAEEIKAVQLSERITTTLFIEADKSNDQFRRIASGDAPRLAGRNIAIFANTSEWYPGEDSFTGEPKRLIAPTLKTTLGNIKRSVFSRKATARYFFEIVVIGTEIFDEIWVKDERLANWRGQPLRWMPEVSRPVRSAVDEGAPDHTRERELQAFLDKNAGREPVLFFGDAAFYKGYDLFIEFVSQAVNVCAVHAGRASSAPEWPQQTSATLQRRSALIREGRLLEIDAYVHSQALKRLYFSAVRTYITTHRLALSSSTVIQASEFARPVLVPDRGVLAHRVRTNGIGQTYRYGDVSDLIRQADLLWRSDLSTYTESIQRFWARFDDESIARFFSERILGLRSDTPRSLYGKSLAC